MKRPKRTIRRESEVMYRGRPLVLIVPPTCDVLLIKEKGRRTAYEVSVLDVLYLGAKSQARKQMEERKARKRGAA